MMGRIAAGTPIEAIQTKSHTINVPPDMLSSGDHFALEVRGDSMVDVEHTDAASPRNRAPVPCVPVATAPLIGLRVDVAEVLHRQSAGDQGPVEVPELVPARTVTRPGPCPPRPGRRAGAARGAARR